MRIILLLMLFFVSSCCHEVIVKDSFNGDSTGGWYVPVCIHGKIYNFLFDTGCSQSYINMQIVEDLNLSFMDSLSAFVGEERKIVQHYQTENLSFNIGGTQFSNIFFVYPSGNKCILGMDFIQKYYWMFDQSKKTFILSSREIEIITKEYDKTLKLKYEYTTRNTPKVNLMINDSIPLALTFDTGLNYGCSTVEDSSIVMTPIMSINHYDRNNYFVKYACDLYGQYALKPKNSPTYYIPVSSMRIANVNMIKSFVEITTDSIYKEVIENDVIGLLGLHFVRKFRMMCIDPVKQELTFCVSPEDSSFIYKGDDVDKVKALIKRLY